MPSGQAAEQLPLPLQALIHCSASAPGTPSRVKATSSPAIATDRLLSMPICAAVGQASTHLPHCVQRFIAASAAALKWSMMPSIRPPEKVRAPPRQEATPATYQSVRR
jgi:hypothetical protein